jgi:hypothetical protein
LRNNASASLDAIRGLCPTKLPGAAEKAATDDSTLVSLAVKAVDSDEGVIIGILSKAGVRDREREMIPLHALKAATYQLVRDIGTDKMPSVVSDVGTAALADKRGVNVNHALKSIACDVLMAWVGYPMPDENSCYVAVRPHDRAIVDAAKAGHMVGFSWEGPYHLKEAAKT